VKLAPLRYSRKTVSLSGISFANPSDGWAVGDTGYKRSDFDVPFNGVVLSTHDGGATWGAERVATVGIPNAVTFVNARDGWMVGGTATHGTILATTDGGASWVEQHPDARGCDLAAVDFVNANDGWAVGSHAGGAAPVLTTTDGGVSWTERPCPAGGGLDAVSFVNAKDGWATAGGGAIFDTTDGGVSWKKQLVDGLQVADIAFVNAHDGWAVGTNDTMRRAVIFATTDSGANWTMQLSRAYPLSAWQTFGGLASVDAVSARQVWVVGDDGLILVTSNGGRSWQRQNSGTTAWLGSVAFSDARHGWVVGETDDLNGNFVSSALLATTNGGATWKKQK
jgi:photosystem II stability/assembly factor-like uncharacterized protein